MLSNCLVWGVFVVYFAVAFDLKGFDDTVLYKLKWQHDDIESWEPTADETEYVITSNNQEKYKCFIPSLVEKDAEEDVVYGGAEPFDLLQPLFVPVACSYRIESYWTYEICHGNYIKQYHEEREGKIMKTQEYYLGKWSKQNSLDLRSRLKKAEQDKEKLKYKKIDGLNLPYLELEMTDGTLCDLNNEPRTTKILYVCYAHGKNEIYSLKETSTCNYEVIVLTPLLCQHPKYRPQETGENIINCLAMTGAPKRPRSLLEMEVENMKLRYQKLAEAQLSVKEPVAVFKVDSKDGTLRMEIIQDDDLAKAFGVENELNDGLKGKQDAAPSSTSSSTSHHYVSNDVKDTSPVDAFLQGKNCLTGGTGWWKYEFCYGRYVRQYHIDKSGETSLILGFFDEAAHIEWLKNNPHKKPKPQGKRTQLTHFYHSGSVCDKTGKRRQTEVKLKCLENSASSASVSLYLLEPQTCQYILGVESPLICNILQKADENGLVKKENSGGDMDETPAEYIVDNSRFTND